eukprot:5577875-Pleurochrysis_carterae.AAC.5
MAARLEALASTAPAGAALRSCIRLIRAPCPSRAQECREFRNGRCSRGSACKFLHLDVPPPPGRFEADEEEDRRGGRFGRGDDEEVRGDGECRVSAEARGTAV